MANPRATFFFEFRKWGWTETHWSRIPRALQDFRDSAFILGQFRIMMLGPEVQCTYIRVSEDEVFRDSLIIPGFPLDPVTKCYNPQLKADPSDVPTTVILARAESGVLNRKSIYISGNPDSLVESGRFVQSAAWMQAFRAWSLELRTNWAFKGIQHDPAINPNKQITSALSTPNGFTFSCLNHGLVTGDKVRVFGFKGTGQNPNGLWTVGGLITNDTFQLLGYAGPYAPITLGKFQRQTAGYLPYTDIILRGVGEHRRGRPFDSPVGRRRRRAVRR